MKNIVATSDEKSYTLSSVMKQMHNATETVRRSGAQDASDVLDPFEIDVDLDCED